TRDQIRRPLHDGLGRRHGGRTRGVRDQDAGWRHAGQAAFPRRQGKTPGDQGRQKAGQDLVPGRPVRGQGHLLRRDGHHFRRAVEGRPLRGRVRVHAVDGPALGLGHVAHRRRLSPDRQAAGQGPAARTGLDPLSATEAGQFLTAAAKSLGPPQWEWIATARIVARERPSSAVVEGVLDGLLSNADQAMVNAFTRGFRVSQVKTAIDRSLPDATASAAALESAQIVALGILVREMMQPAQFAAVSRPFATVLPGPTYRPAPPIDQQIAAFLRFLPSLKGDVEAEVSAVAQALSPPPQAPAPTQPAAGAVPVISVQAGLDPAANYTAAWKQVIGTANQIG